MVDASSSTLQPYRKLWERSESRHVRPFRYVADYLNDAGLRLYEDEEFTIDELIAVDAVDLDRLSPGVSVSRPPKVFADLVGITSSQLSFVILVEDPFLKNTELVSSMPLDEIPDGVIELGSAGRNAASWSGDTRVHLAVILSQNRKAQPGLAFRAGSWVARKSFRVARPIDIANFPVTPVGEEWFLSRGLPSTTTYFVDIVDDDLDQPTTELPQIVKVYANETVMMALAGNENSPAARSLIALMYTDVVTTVLTAGLTSLEGDPSPNGIIDVIISRLTKETGIPRSKLIEYAKVGGGSKLRAVVQAECDLSRTVVSAARRRAV